MFDNPGEIWGSRGCEYSILSNVLYKLNPYMNGSLYTYWIVCTRYIVTCTGWVYWGGDSEINLIILRQRVQFDIIVEIAFNLLICVYMLFQARVQGG